ncbi:hypothetical protein E2C01_061852 [Portunus trituberculatus]|uniref:Uncharacterized protein n=1 Tax=Portunus trituberculatus TaxID=210409 RepID=A0A5B7HC48_PORTR|nr:hypothetical protein [Portunus trituberculatus]
MLPFTKPLLPFPPVIPLPFLPMRVSYRRNRIAANSFLSSPLHPQATRPRHVSRHHVIKNLVMYGCDVTEEENEKEEEQEEE